MAFFTNSRNPKCTALLICRKPLQTPVSYINVQLLSSVPKCMANQAYDILQCLNRNRNYCKYLQSFFHWGQMFSSVNDSFWILIPTDICKFRQDTSLCPEQQWNQEFTPDWPIIAMPKQMSMPIRQGI